MADHRVLFIPGPTEVDEELRAVMARPLCGHRDPAFVALVQTVCTGLRELFVGADHAAFETCPATAVMEAAIRNFVPPGGRTLHLVGGAFGARWHDIARSTGRAPEALTVPLGRAHDPEQVGQRLRRGPPVDAVCITHNETSTGVLQPLAALAQAVQRAQPDALVLVDVVTSLAGAELRCGEWQLDFAFAGTQKCLALPPGLCAYAASERAVQRAATVPDRGFLLDFVHAIPETVAGRTVATPCVPLVFALARQLERIAAEGLEARWARHLVLRDHTLAWAERHGLGAFVVDPDARSPTVSCLDARGRDVKALAAGAANAGFQLDQGYGELKGRTFRIGHMGDHDLPRLEALLGALLGALA